MNKIEVEPAKTQTPLAHELKDNTLERIWLVTLQ